MEVTGTFKYTKTDLVRQGYDPAATADDLLFQPPGAGSVRSARRCALQPHPHRSGPSVAMPVEKITVDLEAMSAARTSIDDIRDAVVQMQSDIASGPIVPNVTPEEIRTYLDSRYDFTKPLPLEEVVADVEQMLQTWHVQVTHPRYFGLFNPSVTVASVVADTLVAMYNPQLATWRTSPAANEIERHTLGWLARKFGLPANASATFTSGGAEANLSAVIVALTRAFPEYGERGLRNLAAAPTIYLTGEAHHSFNKIAHMTGLGRRGAPDRRDGQ